MRTHKGLVPLVWVIIAAVVLGGGYAAYRLDKQSIGKGSIEILAPRAGEKIIQGQPYTLRWNGGDTSKTVCVSIYPHPQGKIDFQKCGLEDNSAYLLDTSQLHLSDPKLGVIKEEFELFINHERVSGSRLQPEQGASVIFELVRSGASKRAQTTPKGTDNISEWVTYRDNLCGLTFKYPLRFSATYEGREAVGDATWWVNLQETGAPDSRVSVSLKRADEWKRNDSASSFYRSYDGIFSSRSIKGFKANLRQMNQRYFETTDGTKRGISYFLQSPQSADISVSFVVETMDANRNFLNVVVQLPDTERIKTLKAQWLPLLLNRSTPPEQLQEFRDREVVGYFNSESARRDFGEVIAVAEKISDSLSVGEAQSSCVPAPLGFKR